MRLLLVLLVGCGRIDFVPLVDSSLVDSGSAARTCWTSWLDHPVDLTPPAPVTSLVDGSGKLGNPSLSVDNLTMFYVRTRCQEGGEACPQARASQSHEQRTAYW